MFQLENVNPSLRIPFLAGPYRYLPNPGYVSSDLSGIDLGKMFSRIFHWEGIKKKAPRILAGAASGYAMGGGWGGAIAGGVSAGAFRRRAGTSLFQDLYRGGLYGMIGGTAVGVGKVALGKSAEAGLVGQAYDYVNKTFFAPQQAVPTVQYDQPIGPEQPIGVPTVQYQAPIGPQPGTAFQLPTGVQGPVLPSGGQVPDSSIWQTGWNIAEKAVDTGGRLLNVATTYGMPVLEYMGAKEQAKAAEYAYAMEQMAMQQAQQSGIPIGMPGYFDPGMGTGYTGSIMPGGGLVDPMGMPLAMPSGGGGGMAVPYASEMPMMPQQAGLIPFELPEWAIPALIGAGGVLLIVMFTRTS